MASVEGIEIGTSIVITLMVGKDKSFEGKTGTYVGEAQMEGWPEGWTMPVLKVGDAEILGCDCWWMVETEYQEAQSKIAEMKAQPAQPQEAQ